MPCPVFYFPKLIFSPIFARIKHLEFFCMIIYGENDLQEKDLADIKKLLDQMSTHARPVDLKQIDEVTKHSYIFSARDGEKLVGMGMLAPVFKMMGFFGNVEDMVVLEDYRGQGVGKKILEKIIEKAKALEMDHLFLTHRQHRAAAKGLYEAYGLEEHLATPYKLYLKKIKI